MSKKVDLTGKKFGKLRVLEKTNQTLNRYVLWRCKCDCGNEIMANTRQLKKGTVKDCGCVTKLTAKNGSIAEDLTGQKFGNLTVLYRTRNKNGRTCWMCKCDCGNEKAVIAHDLKSGKVKSCGCLYYKSSTKVDLTGRKYGRLKVIAPTSKRDSKGSVYWSCVCDCGNHVEVTEDSLVNRKVQSCGCLKREVQKTIPERLHRVDGTCIEYLEKRKSRKDNKSGFRGVYLQKNGRYRVTIGFKGKRINIGTFSDYKRAVDARIEAENHIYAPFLKEYYEKENNSKKE